MTDRANTNASYFNLPSYGKIPEIGGASLKYITTIQNFDQGIQNYDDEQQNDYVNESMSIAERMPFSQLTTPSSAKKKKTGCTCKKSMCLKMYCQCFASGENCSEGCSCSGCRNEEQYASEREQAKSGIKQGLKSCAKAQKRCNCKKSHCRKKYCECYNSGVGCSEACKCTGCSNDKTARVPVPLTTNEILLQEVSLSDPRSNLRLESLSDFKQIDFGEA